MNEEGPEPAHLSRRSPVGSGKLPPFESHPGIPAAGPLFAQRPPYRRSVAICNECS